LDDSSLSSLPLVLLLITVYGLITMMETALTNARLNPLRDQAEAGSIRARHILSLLDKPAQLNITFQFILLLLNAIIAAAAVLLVAQPLTAANLTVAPEVIYALVVISTVLLTLVVGQIIPTTLGSAYADTLAPVFSGSARLLILIFTPVVVLLMAFSKLFARVLGGDSLAVSVTEEEIMTLVDAGQKEGTIEDEEKAMIYSVLQFGETAVREVMVPRIDIVAVEINTPLEVALGKFVETGHSRIPVYDEKIDNIEGLLYAKDLLSLWHNGGPKPQSIRELMRPAYFVPESKRADLVFKEMQNSKIHLAVVVDEYGGTAGIVTIENLIEEIVGDIQDEYDLEEEAEYVQHSEGEYTIDASMNLDDFNELLHVNLPTEDSDTLGGYIYSQLGRVPTAGEVLDDTEHLLTLRVESVEGRRIRKVYVVKQRPDSDTSDAEQPITTPTDRTDFTPRSPLGDTA
jgi:CBS domain containing-hemolysin-like protein